MKKPVATALMLSGLAFPARGQAPLCGGRDAMAGYLANEWREVPRFAGVTGSGALLDLYLSSAGTWTVLVTWPDGQTCVVAAGEAGAILSPQEKGAGL